MNDNDAVIISSQSMDELPQLRNRIAELERDLSEALAGKKALQEREAQFRRIVESISDVIFEVDPKGEVLYLSAIGKNVWGYDREDVIGKNFIELVHPDDRHLLTQRFLELSAGIEYPLIYRIKNKSGEFRWARTKTKPWIENGRFIGAIGTLIDVTDQKQVEEALRESEERYHTLFEYTGTAMSIIEEDMTLSLVNEEFISKTGYVREEIEGIKKWTEFVAEEDLDRMVAQHQLRRAYSGKALGNYEFRFKTKSGEIRDTLLNITLIPGTRKSIASLIDITERKQTEEAHRKSEAKYSSYVENAPDGVFIADDKGRYLEVNKAACLMTGYSKKELLQMSIPDLLTAEYLEAGLAHFKRLIETGMSSGENQFRHKDGSSRWWSVDAVNLSPSRYLGFTKDITKRKQAEEALNAEKHQLAETNTALRVLLQQRQEDRKEIEKKIIVNIRKLVLPHLEKLRSLRLDNIQTNCLDIATANLQQVTSPFLQNLAACCADFTHREIQVANMVREGMVSKEIANILNISNRSVEFHRDNIRKKLGLNQKKSSLYTFLVSLSE